MLAPNWLGDAVMATPFLAALRGALPEAIVSVLCRSYVRAVYERSPSVDRLVAYERKSGVRGRIAAARRMRPRGGFDACVVMPPSFAAALVAAASGARRRVGYRFEGRGILLTDSLPGSLYRQRHLSEAYLRLLEPMTGRREEETPLPVVVPPEEWGAVARRLAGTEDYFVLASGATYGSSKVWPVERFGALARLLGKRTGWGAVVVGGAAERERSSRILDDAGVVGRNLAGECSLPELISVLRGARLVVGNDSGPAHLAAALGRPTVAVFGPTSVVWTAPRGRAVRIVGGEAECAPCMKRECPDGVPTCLLSVSVEEVALAAARLIEEDTGERT